MEPSKNTTALQMSHYTPPAELNDYLAGFVSYTFTGDTNTASLWFLPEGIVEIIFQSSLSSSYAAASSTTFQLRPLHFVGGLHQRAYRVSAEAGTRAFGIRFRAGAFRYFSPHSVRKWSNQLPSPSQVWGKAGLEWSKAMLQAPDTETLIVLSQQFLLQQFRVGHPFPVDSIRQALSEAAESPKVRHLSRRMGWSTSHFRELFSEYFGLPPKAYLRLLRQRRALLHKPTALSFSDWCYQLDYYDPAHFSRDIRAFTGLPPKLAFNLSYFGA